MIVTFPIDRALRKQLFVETSFEHPAKLHLGLLQWLVERYTLPGQVVADPMAGTGALAYAALLQRNVIVREIEPRFLALCHQNAARIVARAGLLAGDINVGSGDARQPWGYQADVVICSPPYGCDSQHHHVRRDQVLTDRLLKLGRQKVHYSKRWEQLARQRHTGSTAMFNFTYGDHPAQIGNKRGRSYWTEMRKVYMQAHAAIRPGGLLVLILKDHVRKGQHVRIADQTVALCEELGFQFVERHVRQLTQFSLWQRRRKEQGKPVIEHEDVLVFERGAS